MAALRAGLPEHVRLPRTRALSGKRDGHRGAMWIPPHPDAVGGRDASRRRARDEVRAALRRLEERPLAVNLWSRWASFLQRREGAESLALARIVAGATVFKSLL